MAHKYQPLSRFLAALQATKWRATFDDLERVLGFPLPASARRWPAWWSNTRSDSHVRAWTEAGWYVDKVRLRSESLVLRRRGPRAPAVRSITVPTAHQTRENNSSGPALSPGFPNTTRLPDSGFVHTAAIEPEGDSDGVPLEFMPQSRYRLAKTMPLNRHGKGPFCRFRVKGLPPSSGVYALTVDGAVAYIGKAEHLAQRWGPQGYGNISPRNCYVGGQSTNCKINAYILLSKRAGRRIDLWIHETSQPGPVEARLIRELDPPWNGQRPT